MNDFDLHRFFEKVDTTGDCWVWQAKKTAGYGYMKYRGKMVGAHRLSYKIHFNDFNKKLWVLHKCDNPSCVNPKHLFQGTPKDNTQDCINKGRHNLHCKKKSHCKRGHKFTKDNTYTYPNGDRACRQCLSLHRKLYYRRHLLKSG